MPGATFLRGDRVSLRVVEPEDADVLARAHNDPDLRRGLLYRHPRDRSAVEAFVEDVANENEESVDLLVCVGDGREGPDPEVAGLVHLFDVEHGHGEVACWLFPEHQDRRYGTEALAAVIDYAFDTLGLHHVVGRIADYNVACQNLVLGLGFSKEGTRREHVFWDGEYHDVHLYGVLADEWRERENGE